MSHSGTYTITDLSRAGSGVARDSESGRVVFIPFTAPGDRVRAEIVGEEKSYAHGRLIEILDRSPIRVEPPCPVFSRCGGCQWQHLPYENQWKTKISGIRHALKRVQVQADVPFDEHPAEHPWNYRNRVQLRGEKAKIGFFAPESRELVEIESCPIARREINAEIPIARAHGDTLSKPYKVEIEVLTDGKTRQTWNAGHAAQGFRQVNDEQNDKLRAWVESKITPGRVVYDLFGGSGNLSERIAARANRIHCVDVSAPRERPEGFPANVEFHRADTLRWVSRQPPAAGPASAIVDPPRIGLGPELGTLAQELDRLGVTELIAVGCDVDAWARDLSRWIKKGWSVRRLAAFDFFPQTVHVESVALLQK